MRQVVKEKLELLVPATLRSLPLPSKSPIHIHPERWMISVHLELAVESVDEGNNISLYDKYPFVTIRKLV